MFVISFTHQFSDGTYTPEEWSGRRNDAGSKAIALTDHDTVKGATGWPWHAGLRTSSSIPAAINRRHERA